MHVARRHRDVLRERPLVRHAEHLRRALPDALVRPPAQRRIDHDARSHRRSLRAVAVRRDRTGTVGTRDARQLDPRIESLADEHVAAVERRAPDLHERFAGAWRRIVDLLDAKVLGTVLAVDLVKSYGTHCASVRGGGGARLRRCIGASRLFGQYARAGRIGTRVEPFCACTVTYLGGAALVMVSGWMVTHVSRWMQRRPMVPGRLYCTTLNNGGKMLPRNCVNGAAVHASFTSAWPVSR